ncbi:MAG: ATP-binding protein [Chloroflexota bacterium]
MSESSKEIVTIEIPSELGYERIPIAAVAFMAKKMGFPSDKIEDLKTAVGEASTNAVEHGNLLDATAKVLIVLTCQDDVLSIEVFDEGRQPIPDIGKERNETRRDNRGWGLGWIRQFVDEASTIASPGRNQIKMIAYLNR